MPGIVHQALVRLFEDRPDLVARLALGRADLRAADLLPLPGDATDLRPAQVLPDLVRAIGDPQRPQAILVVEIQLRRDRKKPGVWAHYALSLHTRYGCPVQVVVVSLDADVASWCGRTVEVVPGLLFRPTVLHPSAFPVVETADDARSDPHVALLSALAHRESDRAVELALVAAEGLAAIGDERGPVYLDMLEASLPAAARRALEEIMATGNYEFQSEFARRHIAQGREEGRVSACAADLLLVLEARGFVVDAAMRLQILATTDLSRLETLLRRAVTAATLAEVLAE